MTYPFYNPREVGGPALEAMLVGRWPLVEEILADLRRQATSASRQHWLLRGPRGIGKTHLIGVVYHQIRQKPDLEAAYLPVWLAEMEAYAVYSTAVLLLQVADQLVEELRLAGDAQASEALAVELAGLEAAGDDPALFEEAFSILQAEAKRRGKILLVLMENLDAMLAGFRSKPEARRFRALLSEEKELLFLSTTPTRYLRQLSDPEEPLYGHLKERILEPLTEEQVGELFNRFIKVTGEGRLEGAVATKGEGRLRRRVLHRLTGGNPRALVMAFSVFSGASGLRSMVKEMEALLDAQTAYFEARLARLAPRERSIVAAMALAPENLTRQGVARATRLPERSLSTQLKRLVEEGHVGQAVGEGGKGTLYELSDGLFRVWYQYRKGRKKLEPLVRFLALWYVPEELEQARTELEEAAAKPRSLLAASQMESVVFQVAEAHRIARSRAGRAERERLWSEVAEEATAAELVELTLRVTTAYEAGGRAELSAIEQQVVALIDGGSLSHLTEARALTLLGVIRGRLGRRDDAIEVYDQIVARYGERDELLFAKLVALVQLSRGWGLGALDRNEEAIKAYDEVVARYGERDELYLAEQVAKALFNKGVSLGELDRTEEELRAYTQVVARYGERDELPLAEWVASALLNKGVSLGALDRSEEEIEDYDEVVARYGERDELPLAEQVAKAFVNKALSLEALDRDKEAIKVCDEVVARYGERDELPLAEQVAKALFKKGVYLGVQDRSEEAIKVYEQLVARFGERDELPLANPVAVALVNKGLSLGALDRSEEAIEIYDQVVARYGERGELPLAEQVAKALVNKGLSLGIFSDRSAEAFEVYDQVVARYGKRNELPLAEWVARATFFKAVNLGREHKPKEAVRTYRKLVDYLKAIEAQDVKEQAPLHGHVLTALEATQPRRGSRGKKGPAARLREALGRVPPELRDNVREIAEVIQFGRWPEEGSRETRE